MAVEADGVIKKLIDKYRGKYWGWKDPKNSLTAKKYIPHLDGDVYMVCMFRRSDNLLNRYSWHRKRRKKEQNKDLVDRYNRSIISAIKEFCEL